MMVTRGLDRALNTRTTSGKAKGKGGKGKGVTCSGKGKGGKGKGAVRALGKGGKGKGGTVSCSSLTKHPTKRPTKPPTQPPTLPPTPLGSTDQPSTDQPTPRGYVFVSHAEMFGFCPKTSHHLTPTLLWVHLEGRKRMRDARCHIRQDDENTSGDCTTSVPNQYYSVFNVSCVRIRTT
jgi:hypothetical protein